jgi:anti-anti-sigma regulatory factor
MVVPRIYTLRPAGDIDLATADVLVAEWFDLVDREAATKVLVDLGRVSFVDFVDSAGLVR